MSNEVTDRIFLIDDRLSGAMRQTLLMQIATAGGRVAEHPDDYVDYCIRSKMDAARPSRHMENGLIAAAERLGVPIIDPEALQTMVAETTPHLTKTAHVKSVVQLSSTVDADWFASASLDGSIRIWDWRSGASVQLLRDRPEWRSKYELTSRDFSQVACSPDGQLLAIASSYEPILLFETSGWTLLRSLENSECSDGCLRFSRDGGYLVTGHDDLQVWSVSDGKLVAHRIDDGSPWTAADFGYKDDAVIAGQRWDRAPLTWSFLGDAEPTTLSIGHGEPCSDGLEVPWENSDDFYVDTLRVKSVRSARAADMTAIGFDDAIALFGSSALQVLRLILCDGLTAVDISPDGTVLAAVCEKADPSQAVATDSEEGESDTATELLGHTIRVWSTRTGGLLWSADGHLGDALSVAFSGDGRLLATGGTDCSVRVWEVETGALVWGSRGVTLGS